MNKVFKVIGWLGSILFALCALPEAITTISRGYAAEYSPWFLMMWFFGEVLSLIYVLSIRPLKPMYPLLFNYIFNLTCLIVIMWYYLGGI